MNKNKWTAPYLPIEILALKLAEEAGEVAREITDSYFGKGDRETLRRNLVDELEQVEFIARTMRKRLENGGVDKLT
jgi:NTP pyrophosphatase (non-canonical NTP hydrolase)